jgi:hypothetical protein
MSSYQAKWSQPIYNEKSSPLADGLNYDKLYLNKQIGIQHGSTGLIGRPSADHYTKYRATYKSPLQNCNTTS